MAKRRKKGSLADKVRSAVSAHKADDTNYGFVELPGGIKSGIAQLNEIKFAQFEKGENEGEYFFYADGVVVSPDKGPKGEPIKGLRTRIGPEPLCDTTNRDSKETSLEEHVARVLNEMRKLGANTEDMEDDELEEVAATLKEAAPYFRFSTSQSEPNKQYPDPKIFHNWNGIIEDYEPDEDDGVVEEEEDIEEEDVEEGEVEEETSEDGEEDIIDLGESADAGDDSAKIRLEELSDEHGLDPEGYDTWLEVAQALVGDEEEQEVDEEAYEDGEEYEDVEEEEPPTKGDVYHYKPPKKRKTVEVEVTAVYKTRQTCNLKNLEEDGVIYKGVSWEDLQ